MKNLKFPLSSLRPPGGSNSVLSAFRDSRIRQVLSGFLAFCVLLTSVPPVALAQPQPTPPPGVEWPEKPLPDKEHFPFGSDMKVFEETKRIIEELESKQGEYAGYNPLLREHPWKRGRPVPESELVWQLDSKKMVFDYLNFMDCFEPIVSYDIMPDGTLGCPYCTINTKGKNPYEDYVAKICGVADKNNNGYILDYWWPEYVIDTNNFSISAFNPEPSCGGEMYKRQVLEAEIESLLAPTFLREKAAKQGVTKLPIFPPGLRKDPNLGQTAYESLLPGEQMVSLEGHTYRSFLSVITSMSRPKNHKGYKKEGGECCFYHTLPPAPAKHPVVNGWTEKFPASAFWRTEELSVLLDSRAYEAVHPFDFSIKAPPTEIPLGCTAYRAGKNFGNGNDYRDLQKVFNITRNESDTLQKICYPGGGDLFPVTGQLSGNFSELPARAYLSRRATYLFGKKHVGYGGAPVTPEIRRINRFNDKKDKLQRIFPGTSRCFRPKDIPNFLADGQGNFPRGILRPEQLGSTRYVYWNHRRACMCPYVGPAIAALGFLPICDTIRPACFWQEKGDNEDGDEEGFKVVSYPSPVPPPGVPYPFFGGKKCKLCKEDTLEYSRCSNTNRPCGPNDSDGGNPTWWLILMRGGALVGAIVNAGAFTAGAFLAAVSGFAQNIAHQVVDLVKQLPAEIARQAIDTLKAIPSALQQQVLDVAKKLPQQMLSSYFNSLAGLDALGVDRFLKGFDQLPDALKGDFLDTFKDIGSDLKGQFLDQFNGLKDQFRGEFLNTLKDLPGSLKDDFINQFKDLKDFAKEDLLNSLKGLPGDLKADFVDYYTRLKDIDKERFLGEFSKFDDVLKRNYLDTLTKIPSQLTNQFTNALTGLDSKLQAPFTDLVRNLPDSLKGQFLNYFDGLADNLKGPLVSTLSGLDSTLQSEFLGSLTKLPTNLQGEVLRTLEKLPGDVKTQFTQVFNKIEDTFKGDFVRMFERIPEQLKSNVLNIADNLSSRGLQQLTGIVDRIEGPLKERFLNELTQLPSQIQENVVRTFETLPRELYDNTLSRLKDLPREAQDSFLNSMRTITGDARTRYLGALEKLPQQLQQDFVQQMNRLSPERATSLLQSFQPESFGRLVEHIGIPRVDRMVQNLGTNEFARLVNSVSGGVESVGRVIRELPAGEQDLLNYISRVGGVQEFLRQTQGMTPEQIARTVRNG